MAVLMVVYLRCEVIGGFVHDVESSERFDVYTVAYSLIVRIYVCLSIP